MTKTGVAAIIMGLVLATGAHAQDNYICASEQIVGFTWEAVDKTWKGRGLTGTTSYVVKRITDPSKQNGATWTVTMVGGTGPTYWCMPEMSTEDNLRCSSTTGDFRMNRKTRRFITAYYSPYVDDEKTVEYTPALTMGKCSPL